MTTPIIRPVSSLTFPSIPLTIPIKEGTVTLDATRTVYGDMDVTVPLVDLGILDDLDPRTQLRMVVTLGLAGETPRTFNMHLRERVVDHKTQQITLRAATDEALLQDWTPTAVDATPRTHEASLRAVVNYVLNKALPGTFLQAGGPDADVTAYWPVTSLIANPRAVNDSASWASGDNANTPLRIVFGTVPPVGNTGIGWNPAFAGYSNMIPAHGTTRYRVSPGRWYVFDFWGMCNQHRASRAAIQWWTSGAETPAYTDFGPSAATGVGSWQRRTVIARCPPGADGAYPYIHTTGNAGSNAEAHYATMARFYEGSELVPYYDGATAAGGGYTYAWAQTADASVSTRTPVAERLPATFTWTPAVSAWDFLEPLCASVGLKLYCDEQRRWFLVDPAVETRPGRITVSEGFNAVEGDDTLTRAGDDYCTLVVVRYRWKDADGIDNESFETAGTPGKTSVVDIPRAPTPGLAAQILRNRGQGRTQDVTALVQPAATPWQEVSISLPGTNDQLGRIQAVSWGITRGLMAIASTGLTEIVPNSWSALENQEWSTYPGDPTWAALPA